VITGRNEERLAEVADGDPAIDAVVCDVTDDDQIRDLRTHIPAIGGIDMLVNCAGVMHFFDVTSDYPLEHQLQEINIDVSGPVRMVDTFLPDLLDRRSTIVNVGSGLAWVPYAPAPVYSGAKAFVHAWTISLREQLKNTSVRVVELLPPVTDTPLAEGLDPSFKRMAPDDLAAAFMQGLRRGRDEIAPGQSAQLKWLSRLAPGFIFGQLNKGSGIVPQCQGTRALTRTTRSDQPGFPPGDPPPTPGSRSAPPLCRYTRPELPHPSAHCRGRHSPQHLGRPRSPTRPRRLRPVARSSSSVSGSSHLLRCAPRRRPGGGRQALGRPVDRECRGTRGLPPLPSARHEAWAPSAEASSQPLPRATS
jgi:uncharacterized oxidoreductase